MREEADQAAQAQPRLVASKTTASGLQPERAAQVLNISRARGLAPDEDRGELRRAEGGARRGHPRAATAGSAALSDFMSQSEAHAALVKDDVGVLSMLEDSFAAATSTSVRRCSRTSRARSTLTPEEESALNEGEQFLSGETPGATTIPRKVAAEVARATPMLIMFGSAALAGGAAGSIFGPLGTAGGALLATAGVAYTLGWGPLYRRLRALTDEDGETLLSDESAKAWATAGAGVSAGVQVGVGAPFFKALPGVSQALQKVGLDAATRLQRRPWVRPR
jgi:hypothetical protein